MLKPRRHFEGVSSESVEQLAGSGRAMAALLKCDSYICNFSIHRNPLSNKKGLTACPNQFANLVTQLNELRKSARGPLANLAVPSGRCLKEFRQVPQARLRVFVRGLVLFRFGNAFAQDCERRIDFPFLPFVEHHAKHFPYIRHRFKMVALIAQHMDTLHDSPALQFFEARADIRAGHTERQCNLLRVDRARGQIEQGMDLGDGPIDAPPRAHFSPVQNELLFHRREFLHRFCNFCHVRNLTNKGISSRENHTITYRHESWWVEKAQASRTNFGSWPIVSGFTSKFPASNLPSHSAIKPRTFSTRNCSWNAGYFSRFASANLNNAAAGRSRFFCKCTNDNKINSANFIC